MRSGVVMSLGPWYGSSLVAKEARIASPLKTYRQIQTDSGSEFVVDMFLDAYVRVGRRTR